MSELYEATKLAAKIQKKVADLLHPLEREMLIMQWPAEYRAILWETVSAMSWERARAALEKPRDR